MNLDRSTRAAVHLQDARDALKNLMGDRYRPMVDRLEEFVREIASKKGADPFQFAIDEAKGARGEGAVQLLAVACEIAESSKP